MNTDTKKQDGGAVASSDGKPCGGESDSIWLLYKIAENRTK